MTTRFWNCMVAIVAVILAMKVHHHCKILSFNVYYVPSTVSSVTSKWSLVRLLMVSSAIVTSAFINIDFQELFLTTMKISGFFLYRQRRN